MAFVYNKFVTGKNFIGRKNETTILANLLNQGENVVLYDSPKTGKKSLVQQAFFNMKIATQRFAIAEVSFLNVRTVADLCMKLGSEVIRVSGLTPGDYADAVRRYLPGTHFVFDENIYAAKDLILSLNWDIDDEDIRAVLNLPYLIAADKGQKMYVYVGEFENVSLTEDGDRFCHIMEDVFKSRTAEDRRAACYILVGSQLNAMKHIFEKRHFFVRQVERVKLNPIDSKDIIDHCSKSFLATGKVVDRDLMSGVCRLFKENVWYINHFCAICDSLSKGYIMEPVLLEALDTIISIHEPRFIATMNDLTTFQVCLLRAVVDGVNKFSSAEVIRHYNLNSSANVLRLKEALCKKEVLTFDENDEPRILDPLFEYWVTKKYFEIKG